jgi:hypothetical protein
MDELAQVSLPGRHTLNADLYRSAADALVTGAFSRARYVRVHMTVGRRKSETIRFPGVGGSGINRCAWITWPLAISAWVCTRTRVVLVCSSLTHSLTVTEAHPYADTTFSLTSSNVLAKILVASFMSDKEQYSLSPWYTALLPNPQTWTSKPSSCMSPTSGREPQIEYGLASPLMALVASQIAS